MKHEFTFKSLPIIPDPSGETQQISYDMESARSHIMDFRMRDFLLCRSWILNFFLSFMAVFLVFALIYGVLSIGIKADMDIGSTPGTLFLLFMMISFITLWLSLGIPSAIKRLKMDLVIKERGQGNWKIIDEKEWEHFCRIVKIAEERRKKLLAEARKKVFER